ncbi:Ran GAP Rna1 [Malassezia caprae]|uniref:Ran GAP Rna1 n=1 Tax=Malassezia caprae TaxID=1381934 RepID=A0AAF0IVV6_9BASI|nr:Ran GAP Rna1 [Malassezia caprae]
MTGADVTERPTGVYELVGKNLKLDTREDIAPYVAEIEKIEPLVEIHLGGNTLGVGACMALADVLKTKKTLKVADLADIFTGRLITEIPDALRALCDAMVDLPELQEVNLSDNAFGGRSAEPMVNLLTNNHHIRTLKLSNNGLGVSGGTIVADALYEAAQKLKEKGETSQLCSVICGRNRLENGSAPHWARAFAAHGGLKEVRMYQNGIRMEGVKAICEGLSHCKDLEVLDLQDNTATFRGSHAVATALPNWPNLRVLNLSDCLLKSRGGGLLFETLSYGHNKKLEALHVQYCDLDRKSLHKLGEAIELHLSELTVLEINGNFADEDDPSINKIIAALEKWGKSDALDELDEMDPEGEKDPDDDEDDNEEVKEAKPDAEADDLAEKLASAHIGA